MFTLTLSWQNQRDLATNLTTFLSKYKYINDSYIIVSRRFPNQQLLGWYLVWWFDYHKKIIKKQHFDQATFMLHRISSQRSYGKNCQCNGVRCWMGYPFPRSQISYWTQHVETEGIELDVDSSVGGGQGPTCGCLICIWGDWLASYRAC